jgi:hypothetical protein
MVSDGHSMSPSYRKGSGVQRGQELNQGHSAGEPWVDVLG